MRWFPVALTLVTLLAASPARAESRSDKATAEALFSEGRKLMDAGRFEQACLKFEASQRLDAGVGTMLNLAECYEQTGRTASAWAGFREVVSAARAAGSLEREEVARQRAQALEPKLSRLTIRLSPGASSERAIEVRRDGALVDPAEFGSPIPVNPGKHTVQARAPGRQEWSQGVELGRDGAAATVTVPPLVASAVSESRSGNRTHSTERSGGSQRTAALIVAGVGVVGVATGTFFGLKASSTWREAKEKCTDYPYGCPDGSGDRVSDAKNAGTLSTIGFVAGAVGLGAGAVLWFTAGPDEPKAQVGVDLGLGRVVVKGRF